VSEPTTEPTSNLSKNKSFLNKKSILKKRSMSEVILQKSLSSSSLVKQAAAVVQAAQLRLNLRNRPALERATSIFSAISSQTLSTDTSHLYASSRSMSGLQTPEHGEKRHIRFDDRVEQCIAVGVTEDEGEELWQQDDDSDSSSDDGLVIMKRPNKKKYLSRSNSKTNMAENKTIEKLEPTTLKYRMDSPDVTDAAILHSVGISLWSRKGTISPSPSQENLHPSNPLRKFLLAEDDDEDDLSWEPSSAFLQRRLPDSLNHDGGVEEQDGHDADLLDRPPGGGMRRTESGMDHRNAGIFGRVVDTMNTARDIAYVIWNVGRKS
jgi:hypothetical protein